jgi:hypothetical protein
MMSVRNAGVKMMLGGGGGSSQYTVRDEDGGSRLRMAGCRRKK